MITAYRQVRTGNTTRVTVTSSLTGTIYYFWYLDGAYVGMTGSPSKSFNLTAGDFRRVDVLDSNSSSFDAIANAPAGYPSQRTLVFTRSIDSNIVKYRIEQKVGLGNWVAIATISDDPSTWQYRFTTPQLLDLTTYTWRVIPVDRNKNDGTAVTLDSEVIVRTPDAPRFTATFDQATTKVTFAAA